MLDERPKRTIDERLDALLELLTNLRSESERRRYREPEDSEDVSAALRRIEIRCRRAVTERKLPDEQN